MRNDRAFSGFESERSDVWESSLERASDGQNPVEKAEGYCGSYTEGGARLAPPSGSNQRWWDFLPQLFLERKWKKQPKHSGKYLSWIILDLFLFIVSVLDVSIYKS